VTDFAEIRSFYLGGEFSVVNNRFFFMYHYPKFSFSTQMPIFSFSSMIAQNQIMLTCNSIFFSLLSLPIS